MSDEAGKFLTALQRAIVEYGGSQEQLARESGVDGSITLRFVAGTRTPTFLNLVALARVLGVSIAIDHSRSADAADPTTGNVM